MPAQTLTTNSSVTGIASVPSAVLSAVAQTSEALSSMPERVVQEEIGTGILHLIFTCL